MSDIIKNDDLFDPDLFVPIEAQAEALKDRVNELTTALGSLKKISSSLSGNNLNNSGDVKKANDDLKRSYIEQSNALKLKKQAEKDALEMTKAYTKAEEDKAKQAAKAAKEVSNQTSAYAKLNAEYRTAAKAAKDLSVELGVNSKEAKKASAEALVLHQRLLQIDQSVGQSQRNVGNYNGELGKLSKGLKGLGGLGNTIASAFGVDTGIFDSIKEGARAIKEYRHEQELSEVGEKGLTIATENHTEAVIAETEAEEAEAVASKASLGLWVLIVAAIGLAVYAIYEWTKGVEDDTEEWSKNNEMLKEGIKTRKDLESQLKKTGIALNKERGYLDDSQKTVLEILTETAEKKKELELKGFDEYKKINELYADDLKKAKKDDDNNEVNRLIDLMDKKKAIIKDELVKQYALIKQNSEGLIKIAELSQKPKEKEVKKEENIEHERFQARLKEMQSETINKEKQLDLQRLIDIDNAQQTIKDKEVLADTLLTIENKYKQSVADLEVEGIGKVKKAKELKGKEDDSDYVAHQKLLKEQAEELKKMVDEEIQFLEEAAKRKNEILNKQIDDDLAMRQRNIIQQQELAAKGLNNTLAFEKAAADKDQLQKQKLAIQQKKQEDAIELGKIFLKLYTAFAEKDPDGAAMKAMQQTMIAKGLSTAISGSFWEGTENVADDLKGNKVHNGRDGYVVAVDGSERILTGQQNDLIGDMSNEMLAKLAFNYQMGIPNSVMAVSDSAIAFEEFRKEIKELKDIIRERPVSTTNIHPDGTVSKEMLSNGIKKVIHYKSTNNNFL